MPYNTTIPLRAKAEISQKEVSYNSETHTAYIDEKGANRHTPIPRVNSLSLYEFIKYTSKDYMVVNEPYLKNIPRESDFEPYTVPLNHSFLLGDNRDDSNDSRYWVNKYVPHENLLGKIILIVNSKRK